MGRPDCYESVRYKPATSIVVDDLLQGLNEWRNIQDIVRLTFKAFHDVLKAQGDAIKTLERVMDTKANRNEVASALAVKANASETSARLHDLETALFRKADVVDMNQRALKSDVEQALGSSMGEVLSTINQKASFADIDGMRQHSENTLSDMRAEISRLNRSLAEMRHDLTDRATLTEVSEALQTKADQDEIEAALKTKVDRSTFIDSQAKKADMAYVDQMEADLKTALSDQAARLVEKADKCNVDRVRESSQMETDGMQARVGMLANTVARLESRLAEEETARREAVSRKMDSSDVARALEKKADIVHVDEALQRKAESSTVANLKESQAISTDVVGRISMLKEELEKKADVKDVCCMLDTKANTEDVNKVLMDMCSELDKKAPAESLSKAIQDQAIVNAGLCADMSLGRWIWKSGKTKAGKGIPWNVQTINSDPDNFIWEKDKATIMTIAPGLYEVTFGIFSKKKPMIQVLVNGDPVLSAINSSSYVTHHSSGRLTTVGNHPSGNVTGLTCIDFLALPAKARVAITYSGEDKGEGFLSLKRL